jgi:hypothetical protein
MNNAKFALIIAAPLKSPTAIEPTRYYNTFLNNIRLHTPPLKGIESLSDNAWQIDLRNGLDTFQTIIHEAKGWLVSLRVLFVEDAPDWIKYPADAPLNPN